MAKDSSGWTLNLREPFNENFLQLYAARQNRVRGRRMNCGKCHRRQIIVITQLTDTNVDRSARPAAESLLVPSSLYLRT